MKGVRVFTSTPLRKLMGLLQVLSRCGSWSHWPWFLKLDLSTWEYFKGGGEWVYSHSPPPLSPPSLPLTPSPLRWDVVAAGAWYWGVCVLPPHPNSMGWEPSVVALEGVGRMGFLTNSLPPSWPGEAADFQSIVLWASSGPAPSPTGSLSGFNSLRSGTSVLGSGMEGRISAFWGRFLDYPSIPSPEQYLRTFLWTQNQTQVSHHSPDLISESGVWGPTSIPSLQF